MNKNICPKCGNPKKPWFEFCFDCNEKEKQKPTCEVCGKEVPEGHYLCKQHWEEKKEEEKKLRQLDYVKDKKETDFREKFEGKYHSPFGKVKSKSELLIAYFLHLNGIKVNYEVSMQIGDQNLRPDFVIEDDRGNMIILEHFGSERSKEEWKIPIYTKFCKENERCFFIHTNEDDIFNLKDALGIKFNKETPLKKAIWK
ncbi:MAG: hypothetical protein ACP5NZ_02560 [Nanobdellota archaeon]